MRNPDLIKTVHENELTTIDIEEDIPDFYPQEYDPFDDKSMKKYFSDLKKLVRGSEEYQSLISFLRMMGLDHCSILPNLSNEGRSHIKIEIHHHPLDLETICRVIYRKRQRNGESLDTRSVAYEVMWNHYSLLVGLIPLCETVHELVHSGVLFLNANKVYGFYKHFIERYRPYFEQEEIDTLNKIAEESANTIQDYATILAKNYIEVDMHTSQQFTSIQDIKKIAHNVLTTAQTSDQKLLVNNVINEVKPQTITPDILFKRKENPVW